MPILNSIKRRLVEHFATLVNELHIGSDGTQASADDGGARSLAKITPKVVIIDDQTLLVEGTFGTTFAFNTDIQEVYLQYRDPTTGEFIPCIAQTSLTLQRTRRTKCASRSYWRWNDDRI